MKKTRHSDEQIVKILREADKTSVPEAARKHQVTEQTVYRWRRLYDSMQVKGLKSLRDENTRIKRLLAGRDLELDMMKETNEKSANPSGESRNGADGLSARRPTAPREPPLRYRPKCAAVSVQT